MRNCIASQQDRKKLFWATQPAACGSEFDCGYQCGDPGLAYQDTLEGCVVCKCCPPATHQPGCPNEGLYSTRTISTANWLTGLIINMLMTDGRKPDTPCGYRPGTQGGHWSESYITGSTKTVGTLMRTVQPGGRIEQSITLIVAYAQSTLNRLVERGVAASVNVTGTYIGNAVMRLDIVVNGYAGNETRVAVSGARLANGWVWQ